MSIIFFVVTVSAVVLGLIAAVAALLERIEFHGKENKNQDVARSAFSTALEFVNSTRIDKLLELSLSASQKLWKILSASFTIGTIYQKYGRQLPAFLLFIALLSIATYAPFESKNYFTSAATLVSGVLFYFLFFISQFGWADQRLALGGAAMMVSVPFLLLAGPAYMGFALSQSVPIATVLLLIALPALQFLLNVFCELGESENTISIYVRRIFFGSLALGSATTFSAFWLGLQFEPSALVPKTWQMIIVNSIGDSISILATWALVRWSLAGYSPLRILLAAPIDLIIAAITAVASLYLGLLGTPLQVSLVDASSLLIGLSSDHEHYCLVHYFGQCTQHSFPRYSIFHY